MVSIWHVIMFALFINITIFAAFYSGFYFGWMSKKEVPPVRMPTVSDLIESMPVKKKEEEVSRSFYD